MACVFTKVAEKLSHLSTISEGLLTHSDDVLNEVWGRYDKKLWSFEENQINDPPVLLLLFLLLLLLLLSLPSLLILLYIYIVFTPASYQWSCLSVV